MTGRRLTVVEPRAALDRVLGVHLLQGHRVCADVVGVADALVGLHGTSPSTAYLSLHARIAGFRCEDLDQELYERAGLIRLKGMRGTVFLLSRALAPIVFSATHRVTVDRDRRQLGVDERTYRRAAPAVLEALTGRSFSVSELRKTLTVDVDLAAIVALLCDEARIVRDRPMGSRKSSAFRYRRWDDAFPGLRLDSFGETEATRLLIDQYIGAYGPVTADDIVWWTGLPATRVRQAVTSCGSDIVPVEVTGVARRFLMRAADLETALCPTSASADAACLLPELDPFAMGYRDRSRFLDAVVSDMVIDRGGNATSVVLIQGRVAHPTPSSAALSAYPFVRPRQGPDRYLAWEDRIEVFAGLLFSTLPRSTPIRAAVVPGGHRS